MTQQTNITASLVKLFDAPSTKWSAVADALTLLTDETATIAAPVIEGDTVARYASLSMAADSVAARLDRWTLNTALCVAIVHAFKEASEGGQAPTRADLVAALLQVPAFVARNTPDGKDSVPAQTFNRCVAGAVLHMHGSVKQRKQWGDNAGLNTLGGVGPFKGHRLDKTGLAHAVQEASTKGAGRTKAKEGQGKADASPAPTDAVAENKALVAANKQAVKAVQDSQAKLAALVNEVRAMAENTTLSDTQLRSALRDLCDANAPQHKG